MLAEISIAAATAVVGYDLLQGSDLQQSDQFRTLVAVALAGSAAGLDTEVQIFVGPVKCCNVFNKATGAPTRDHMFRLGVPVNPGVKVIARVVDAPATNPINLIVDFAP